MDFLLNRYRNLTVLLVVIVGQLLLLAYQVKTNNDIPVLRVWAVSTVIPVEDGLEWLRRHTIGLVGDYFDLIHVREQNQKLQKEIGQVKLENHYLKNQLSTADRAKELAVFQEHTPSRTLAARVVGNGTGSDSKVVFVDRGSSADVEAGMAVVTPDGIVGKVVAAYPTASLVMLINDASFAAGVVSEKHRVHGTLKGLGHSDPKCRIDYVQNEEPVDMGEWFYTSGDDGIFPRGFPVGQVSSVSNGRTSKNIIVTPSGWQGGLDEVLIVVEGVHQPIPETRNAAAPVKILPPPADEATRGGPPNPAAALTTDADKLRQQYRQLSEDEKIQFGVAGKPPDFTKLQKTLGAPAQGAAPQTTAKAPGQTTTPPPASGEPAQKAAGTASTGATPLTRVAEPNSAAAPKPKVRAPVLETDPTDDDPANEAVARRIQQERKAAEQSKPKAVPGDGSTEILPSAPPPKRSIAPATKTPAPKTPSGQQAGTGQTNVRKPPPNAAGMPNQ